MVITMEDDIVNVLKRHQGFDDFINDKIGSLDYTYQGIGFNVVHYPDSTDCNIDVEIQAGVDCNNITDSQREAILAFKEIARRYFRDVFMNIDERNF